MCVTHSVTECQAGTAGRLLQLASGTVHNVTVLGTLMVSG